LRLKLILGETALEELQAVKSKLMVEVVTVLLMLSAEHTALSSKSLENPWIWSRRCRLKTLFEMDRATLPLLSPLPRITLRGSEASLADGWSPNKSSSVNPSTGKTDQTLARLTITEKQVEKRVLIDKEWLTQVWEHHTSKLIPFSDHLAQTTTSIPSKPCDYDPSASVAASNSLKASADKPEFFIDGHGIDREVIITNIGRYLGKDVMARPGTYKVGGLSQPVSENSHVTKHLYRTQEADTHKKATILHLTGLLHQ
jgi:hypothetical protein